MDKNKKLFPQRLWELIHDPKYNFCLRWSPDGQRVYLNRSDFELHYLKTPNNQFHTQKAISFVRQMNMYGFRKVDDSYYENDNFKRNCPHLLKNMVRRHSNKAFFSAPNVVSSASASTNAAVISASQHSQLLTPSLLSSQPISLAPTVTIATQNNQPQNLNHSSTFIPHNSLYDQQQLSQPIPLTSDINFRQQIAQQDTVDCSASSIGATAAFNSNIQATCSPLASSLYLRLAELNSGNQASPGNQVSNVAQIMNTDQQTVPSLPQMAPLSISPGTTCGSVNNNQIVAITNYILSIYLSSLRSNSY